MCLNNFKTSYILSAGTNDEVNNINSDREIIRSNPDIKTSSVQSPRISLYSNNEPTNGIKNFTCDSTKKNDQYTLKNDLSNLSNNLSLNLSIHTAEEFGIEMLAWLNNEGNSRNGSESQFKIDRETSQSKLTTNATLV